MAGLDRYPLRVGAGTMDRRIQLRRRNVSRGSMGGTSLSYTVVATMWAQKLDLLGSQFFAAQQVEANTTTRWRIRYRDDIKPDWRITDAAGNDYDITQISEIGRKRWLEIFSVAVLGDPQDFSA